MSGAVTTNDIEDTNKDYVQPEGIDRVTKTASGVFIMQVKRMHNYTQCTCNSKALCRR